MAKKFRYLTGRDWEKQAFSPEKIWIKFFALETSLANPPGSETKPNLALRPKGGPRGPLGAQNPQCPFFEENIFFLLLFNWVLKNNPNESKKPKKLGIFRSITPKMASATNGQPQAQFWVLVFFLVPNYVTILSWRSTSTLTKTVFGTFSDSFRLALNKVAQYHPKRTKNGLRQSRGWLSWQNG